MVACRRRGWPVGITRYAADELGDVVFVELPTVGRMLTRGETFGVIESVKTASDLYSPVAGEVRRSTPRSRALRSSSTANPTRTAGSIRLRLTDPSEALLLKDADAYRALIGG